MLQARIGEGGEMKPRTGGAVGQSPSGAASGSAVKSKVDELASALELSEEAVVS